MIVRGDAFRLPLRDECAQMCLTSIPFWGLRVYSGCPDLIFDGDPSCAHDFVTERYYTERTAAVSSNEAFSESGEANAARVKAGRWREDSTCERCGCWRGAYGLEPTLDLYIQHTVQAFREVRRVLRRDAVLFLNIGDAHTSGNRATFRSSASDNKGHRVQDDMPRPRTPRGLKPKDLVGLPWAVAFALRDDGWFLRSEIILEKRSCVPESAADRVTKSHEQLFMLTKNQRYYFDGVAIAERSESDGTRRARSVWRVTPEPNTWTLCRACRYVSDLWPKCPSCNGARAAAMPEGYDSCPKCHGQPRCPSCDSTDITRHFAGFGKDLIERAIKCGTSAKGACMRCGAPWTRITKPVNGVSLGKSWHDHKNDLARGQRGAPPDKGYHRETLGWEPSCKCGPSAGVRPCLVLDQFSGTGSTQIAAERLGRRAVCVELSQDYVALAAARTAQLPLL